MGFERRFRWAAEAEGAGCLLACQRGRAVVWLGAAGEVGGWELKGGGTYLFHRPGEVVRAPQHARHAGFEVGIPRVCGAVHGECVARGVCEGEVELAVFARLGDVGGGADGCGEGLAEVWGGACQ